MTKNLVLLVGQVWRPPTIHRNRHGHPMAILDLRTENPENEQLHDFHNVICFGGLADWCGEYLKVRTRVCVLGQLSMRRWKQGTSWRTKTQVIVRQLALVPTLPDAPEPWEITDDEPSWGDSEPAESILDGEDGLTGGDLGGAPRG